VSETWKFGINYNPKPYRSGLPPHKDGNNFRGNFNHHSSSQPPKLVDPIIKFSDDVTKIASEISMLIVRKQIDYGSKNISNAPGGAMNGLIVRMHDKMARWANLFSTKADPKNETIEDTLMDIAGYAIIALMVQRGLWDNEENNLNS